jgi:hypothetical protein
VDEGAVTAAASGDWDGPAQPIARRAKTTSAAGCRRWIRIVATGYTRESAAVHRSSSDSKAALGRLKP